MASIRIVDVWLRSPVSQPTAWRSVMVIADAWAEQRVLMRAYAGSADQTRPTIVLHGVELAIGPASADANGPWGIHVEPPLDGRAQELREQLQLAAKRMAGSKGTPARLEDEVPAFERKRTNNWMPGAPRDEQGAPPPAPPYDPSVAASQSLMAPSPPYQQHVTPSSPIAQSHAHAHLQQQAYVPPPAPPPAALSPGAATMVPHLSVTPVASAYPDARLTPIRVSGAQAAAAGSAPVAPHPSSASSGTLRRQRGWTSPVKPMGPDVDRPVGSTTAMGFTSGAGAQSPAMRLGLTQAERDVLNALGETAWLSAQRVRAIVGVDDPVAWMEQLMQKLAATGMDLIAPGPPQGGEPTYVLRR